MLTLLSLLACNPTTNPTTTFNANGTYAVSYGDTITGGSTYRDGTSSTSSVFTYNYFSGSIPDAGTVELVYDDVTNIVTIGTDVSITLAANSKAGSATIELDTTSKLSDYTGTLDLAGNDCSLTQSATINFDFDKTGKTFTGYETVKVEFDDSTSCANALLLAQISISNGGTIPSLFQQISYIGGISWTELSQLKYFTVQYTLTGTKETSTSDTADTADTGVVLSAKASSKSASTFPDLNEIVELTTNGRQN